MKKLLYSALLFFPILVKAQTTLPITVSSNLVLDTMRQPHNTPAPIYLTERTYLNGGPANGDNGIPENRFYQVKIGTATGGSGNMPYSLAYQLANKYIIQRSGWYLTTLKVVTHYDNVFALRDSLLSQYDLIKGMKVKTRADSTISAINAERTRAISVENTKEATIAATSAADYFRGDKSMQNFVNAARSASSAGVGISYSGGVITNTAPDQTVTVASGNRISVTGTYPNFTVAYVEPTINNNVTRPINSTTFTVSATKQARVSYTVSMQCTATIGSAANGKIDLQYSTNGGSTWTTVGTFGNSNTVTLAVALNSVQISTGQLVGEIPAGALCRMVSTLSGVNAVATYLTGQETY